MSSPNVQALVKARFRSRQDSLEELERIFGELQTDFHDLWDWMGAAFSVECLKSELELQDARILELEEREKLAIALLTGVRYRGLAEYDGGEEFMDAIVDFLTAGDALEVRTNG